MSDEAAAQARFLSAAEDLCTELDELPGRSFTHLDRVIAHQDIQAVGRAVAVAASLVARFPFEYVSDEAAS